MTNEEAIALLKQMQISLARGTGKVLNAKALGLAISALEERKKGHWISLDDGRGRYNEFGYKCSKCGEQCDYEENFCPNCGAVMRGGEECLETK